MFFSLIISFFKNKQLRFFLISIFFLIFAFAIQTKSHLFGNILFGVSFIIGGYYKAKEGIVAFVEKRVLNVDLLMVIAAIGSSIIGYWEEGAILIVIFSLSGALEEFVTSRSTTALESLLKLVPEKASKIIGDVVTEVPIEELQIGDCLLVRPGERIPVDGIVVDGESSIDQATITGESIPVFVRKNAPVFTGTLNLTQSVVVKNTTDRENTAVERVVKLIEEAETKKSKQEQFVEKFERTYVKVVLLSSLLIFLFFLLFIKLPLNVSFYRTMVFLVVASPCAVVAATIPVTLSAISNGARHGILFKGGEAVEKIADIDFLAFDKTGTITEGKPQVVNMYIHEEQDDIMNIIMTLESKSTHPLATAITEYLSDKGFKSNIISGITDVPGFGVSATIEEVEYKIGALRFTGENIQSQVIEQFKTLWLSEAKTLVYISKNGTVIGIIALQDEMRSNASQTILEMKRLEISPVMLTGDNEKTANVIASAAGIETYFANCLPETKVSILENAKNDGKYTAMVGDGMNDGPAIAVAEVGFAMGGGSDLASGTADVVLMKNDLSQIPYAYRLSKKHNRVIRQNIYFALTIIILLVVSNLIYGIELPFAVVFHEGSTILVILNGLRLLKNV